MYELEKGSTLQGGKYRIEGILGRGGFGITYRGSTTAKVSGELGEMEVKTPVAIKEFFMNTLNARDNSGVVTSPTQGSQEQVERFRQKFIKEARSLANMHHKNIINVSDVFEENGTVYYVMRYLIGGSLTDKVKQLGPLSEAEAVVYIRQVGAALDYLHSRHMCHLDVKPGNVLINDEGEATLIDFGIAKVFGSDGQALTDSPVTYTTHYAPLEQYQGVQDFSPQTDLYSLGATLYYLVTGENPPVASEVNEEGMQHKPADISVQMWRAIVAAMQPRRKDRPESVALWLKMLDGLDNPQPILQPEPASQPKPESEETVMTPQPAPQPTASEETVMTPQPTPQPTRGEETVITPQPTQQPQSQETVIPSAASKPKPALKPSFKPSPASQPSKPKAPVMPPKKKGINKWLIIIPIILVVLLIVLGGAGYAVYRFVLSDNPATETVQQPVTLSTSEAIFQLDGLELSLSKIQDVENRVRHDGTTEQEEILRQRAIALKHLYTEVFLPNTHRVQSLRNIYMLHATEFSERQRSVLEWFMNLPARDQEQWEYVQGKVENFVEFRQRVEEEIERSHNN